MEKAKARLLISLMSRLSAELDTVDRMKLTASERAEINDELLTIREQIKMLKTKMKARA